jgi:hypothetical protein
MFVAFSAFSTLILTVLTAAVLFYLLVSRQALQFAVLFANLSTIGPSEGLRLAGSQLDQGTS